MAGPEAWNIARAAAILDAPRGVASRETGRTGPRPSQRIAAVPAR